MNLDWKTNLLLEPYAANLVTDKQNSRKPPKDRDRDNQVENVGAAENFASSSKQTYSNETLLDEHIPIVKKVYVVPAEFTPKSENNDFTPPQHRPQINAANYIPEEDLINHELEDVNREEIIPRVALGHRHVLKKRGDDTVSWRAPIEEAKPINDEFYQPIPKQSRNEGIFYHILY